MIILLWIHHCKPQIQRNYYFCRNMFNSRTIKITHIPFALLNVFLKSCFVSKSLKVGMALKVFIYFFLSQPAYTVILTIIKVLCKPGLRVPNNTFKNPPCLTSQIAVSETQSNILGCSRSFKILILSLISLNNIRLIFKCFFYVLLELFSFLVSVFCCIHAPSVKAAAVNSSGTNIFLAKGATAYTNGLLVLYNNALERSVGFCYFFFLIICYCTSQNHQENYCVFVKYKSYQYP